MTGAGSVSVTDTAGLYLCVQGDEEDKMRLLASMGGSGLWLAARHSTLDAQAAVDGQERRM